MRKKSKRGISFAQRDYVHRRFVKNTGYLTCKQSGKLQNNKPRYSLVIVIFSPKPCRHLRRAPTSLFRPRAGGRLARTPGNQI